jgi:hypothetical protein
MPKKLKMLSITHISHVDDPANPGARVSLWKRRDDGKQSETRDLESLGSNVDTLAARFDDLLNTVAAKKAPKAKGKTMDELKKVLTWLGIDLGEEDGDSVEKTSGLWATVTKVVSDLLGAITLRDAEITKLKGDLELASLDENEQFEKGLEGLPQALQKQLRQAREDRAEVAAMKQEKERSGYRAQAIYKNLAASTDDIGDLLYELSQRPDGEALVKSLGELLAGADKAVAEGAEVTKVIGVTGDLQHGGAADEQIHALATERVKASNGEMTYAKAVKLVNDEQPELMEQSRQERLRRARDAA